MRRGKTIDWEPKKLDELGAVGRGKSRHRPRNDPILYGGPYPFVQTADIMASEFYITSYSKTYSEAGLSQSKMWEPNTLCMTIAGENTAETAILAIKACFPDSVVGFVADPDKSDVRFVKYALDTMKHRFKSVTKGATQDNLSLDKLLSFDILTPPLPVQCRIADILSAYDDLIENNTRRIQILERMAQALYREWFVHFRFPGDAKVKLAASPLGKIPQGWEVAVFTDIADILSGGTPSTRVGEYWAGDIPWFTPRDATGSFYVTNTEKHITQQGVENCASDLYPKDIIFITARGTVGKLALAAVPMAVNQSCYAVRGKPGYDQRFVFLMLHTQIDYLKKNTGGATFGTIITDTFKRMAVVKPSPSLAHGFEELVGPFFERVRLLHLQNNNLRRTRDLLLPKLISGALDAAELGVEIEGVAP